MRSIPRIACAAACLLTACASPSPELPEGTWTGGLSAHEGHYLALTYEVRHAADSLAITLAPAEGDDAQRFAAHHARLDGDTLTFRWTEPEGPTPLVCTFVRDASGTFAGPCADASGKSADFTMEPPA